MPQDKVPGAPPRPNFQCPLCGGDNACAPAHSGSFETPCWCTQLVIDAETLDQIDSAQRGQACLCPRCAGIADIAINN